ncbi:holin [Streptomyces sp. NPDC057302]|uniref:holin n=1 Tax=Streptomyces sp. NPDC057302 TaxID=3346094 RepID=UPI003641D7A3
MTTAAFWKATFERMVRTMAQATLGAVSADGLGIVDVDWAEAFSVGGLAAALALLTAIATSGGTTGPGITETVAAPSTPRGPTSL